MTTTGKTRTIDYTKLELGRVTRTWKGETVGVIARCGECGKRGERTVSIPAPEDAARGQRPMIRWLHTERSHDLKIPIFGTTRMSDATDSHHTELVGGNVDDLLTVKERKRYDAFVQALRDRLAKYDPSAAA